MGKRGPKAKAVVDQLNAFAAIKHADGGDHVGIIVEVPGN